MPSLPDRIPTGIPQHWRTRWRRYYREPFWDKVWQAFLVLVGGALVVAALSSGVVFVTAIAGIVVSIVLADDIRATVNNIWDRNFWVWKV